MVTEKAPTVIVAPSFIESLPGVQNSGAGSHLEGGIWIYERCAQAIPVLPE